jgi:ribonuclease HI
MMAEPDQNATMVGAVLQTPTASEKGGEAHQGDVKMDEDHVVVYVDGSCTENGGTDASGGYGVFWGKHHPLNTNGRLAAEETQTNNRAEMQAACTALNQAKASNINKVAIYSDSKYVVNGMNTWRHNWAKNNWNKSNGKTVCNKDKWKQLIESANSLESVKFVHVFGHSGITGNEQADRLAGLCHTTATGVKGGQDGKDHQTLPPELAKVDMSNKPKHCPICGGHAGRDCLQCSDCVFQIHYQCTDLPLYQLTKFKKGNRKYTCANCVSIDSEIEDMLSQTDTVDQLDDKNPLNGAPRSSLCESAGSTDSDTRHIPRESQADMAQVVKAITAMQEILISHNKEHLTGLKHIEDQLQYKQSEELTECNNDNIHLTQEINRLNKLIERMSQLESDHPNLQRECTELQAENNTETLRCGNRTKALPAQ